MVLRAKVVGTGMYAPGEPVPNAHFDRLYGRDVGTFLAARNIFQRHFLAKDEVTSDMAVAAAREALTMAGLQPEDLDLIIVATDTPDYVSPATSAVVQYKLGARRAGTFDLNAACAGFVTALDMGAKALVADPWIRRVLVVGAYGMSRYLDWQDYKTATLFADGAGAVVLAAAEDGPGILASCRRTDGQYHDYMGIFAGGTRSPATAETVARGDHFLRFRQKIPVEMNGRAWPELTRALMDRLDLPVGRVDHFFMTQINILSIRETLAALGVPAEKSHNIMDRFAYTGSAAIPMALADAVRQGRLRRGDLAVLIGSGGGVAMAALALTWAFDP